MGITVFFLCGVAIIVTCCVIEWMKLLRGSKAIVLQEGAYVKMAKTSGTAG